ncbi:prolyl 3-hydroxylase OGFOD1-like [Lineus longissimus]|uniref:prolyl 3-hydroxylase OGFOD1-like n=1 Tax=Lineus longissimus TaxID=88925 RepID=UPI002B4CEA97
MADMSGSGSSRSGASRGKKKGKLALTTGLNPQYVQPEFIHKLGESFQANCAYTDETQTIIYNDPFRCCVLPNFIKDERFLEGLKDELLDQIFYEKNNDLYKFQQTDDLRKISSPHVRALRKFLYSDFLAWLREVTGIQFSEKVDMTCSKYDYTDTLLCHDDELEGRRIAFILYLVPPWKDGDGGALEIFNTDENRLPKDVIRSIFPKWNSFAFFEVNPVSFHQVAEVLTEDKTRLSVNGWFHGPPILRPEPFVELRKPLRPYIPIDEEILYEWINPVYLEIEVQSEIQEKFEQESEIELQGFLREEKYLEVARALAAGSISWQQLGPPNKRNYSAADQTDLPDILNQCLEFFQSDAMFLILSNLTGLSLHELAANSDSSNSESEGSNGEDSDRETKGMKKRVKRRKLDKGSSDEGEEVTGTTKPGKAEKNPRCRGAVRRWRQGCYTLIHDTDSEGAEYALDAMLFCDCRGWQQEYGGFTSYIARGEDEELLTVNPTENALALVYRDKETMKFVKHINNHIKEMSSGPEFYDISLVYFE